MVAFATATPPVLTPADQRRRWWYVVALVVLNAADLVTTRLVLDAGGQETNPLMAPIMDGWLVPILAKTMALLAVALCVAARPGQDPARRLGTGDLHRLVRRCRALEHRRDRGPALTGSPS